MGHILMDQQVAGGLALICVVPGDSLSTDVLAAEAGIPSADFGQVWREQFGEPLALTMHRLQGRCVALASATIQSLHESTGPKWGVVSPRVFVDSLRHLSCFVPCDFHRSEQWGESLERGLSAACSERRVEIVSLAPFALIVKRDFEAGDPGLLATVMGKFWGWAEARGLLPGLQGVYVIPDNDLQSKSFIALRYDAGIDFGNEESLGAVPLGRQIVNVPGVGLDSGEIQRADYGSRGHLPPFVRSLDMGDQKRSGQPPLVHSLFGQS